jgi:NCAIR mutase (PurE)-related protein
MNKEYLTKLLSKVQSGELEIDTAIEKLKDLPFEDIDFCKVDHHRAIRQGVPEVIFCKGKAPEHTAKIFERLIAVNPIVIGTKADSAAFEEVKKITPNAVYHSLAQIITVGDIDAIPKKGNILIVTAGTADIPIADEAYIVSLALGNNTERLYDIGVSGIHRLFASMEKLHSANVIIAVAGMEGALPSIIGGLVDIPVIAVPTSIGYGANFNGLSALLTMINSCSAGITVVNIDNGFGAAYFASMINK